MIYEATVEIERPIDEVFEVATCMRRCAVWRASILDSKMDSNDPAHVGSTFTQQFRLLSHTSPSKYVITELEPPRLFAIKEVEGLWGLDLRFTFKPTASGTQFHVVAESNQLAAPIQVLNQIDLGKSILERGMRNEQDRLKMLMESDVDLWTLTSPLPR